MDSHQQPYASQAQADTTLFPEQTRESLQALAVKLQPLIEGHRLDNLVDLLSLLSDIVDLLDPAMVDRLAQLFEQVTSVGWSVGNAVRVAKAEPAPRAAAKPERPAAVVARRRYPARLGARAG